MPSFDVVSEIDWQEVRNATDQANREITNRYDFKGSNANIELLEKHVILHAQNEFQIEQMTQVWRPKLSKRGIDLMCLNEGKIESNINATRQRIDIREGIESEIAKKLVKHIKQIKLKVQAQIQGDKLRITGKKRDDLQQAISALKDYDCDVALQYNNFRD